MYAYQISAIYLDKQKNRAYGTMLGPFHGPGGGGGLTRTYAYHCISFCMDSMYTKFQPSVLISEKVLKWGGPEMG